MAVDHEDYCDLCKRYTHPVVCGDCGKEYETGHSLACSKSEERISPTLFLVIGVVVVSVLFGGWKVIRRLGQ